jgi:hypothetical protein
MPVWVIRPMAARRVEPRDGAPLERLAPDRARALIQAWRPAAHACAPSDRRVLGAGRAEPRRDWQEAGAIAHPRGADLAHLAEPVVDVPLRAPPAEGRLTTHRHALFARPTRRAAVCEGPPLVGVAAPEHLRHKLIIVGGLVTRMGLRNRPPGLGQDVREAMPGPRGCSKPQGAPREGGAMRVGQRLYHPSPAQSTLSAVFMGHPHAPHCP